MGKFKEDLNELQIRFLKTCQHKVFQSSFLVICYIGCNAWETLFVFKTKVVNLSLLPVSSSLKLRR